MSLMTLFLTCADSDEAQKISDILLDNKLAACVRSADVESVFIWKGQKEQDSEKLLIIDTSEDRFDAIEAAVKEAHSYETFVLTAYQVVRASAGVEEWVEDSLK
jgi:periplasmic divalent cation tolerance protein